MTKIISLLLVLVGLTLIGASLTSRASSPEQIAQQRQRFEEMESVPTFPPSRAAEPLDLALPEPTREPAPTAALTSDQWSGTSGRGNLDAGLIDVEPRILNDASHQVASKQSLEPPPSDMPAATHITIPAVGIDTDVVEVSAHVEIINDQRVRVWQVADWAAGHHATSSDPGEGGNIVLAGHDDYRGEVFRGLHDISIGDRVRLTSPAGEFTYIVEEVHVRRIADEPLSVLLAVGQFMAPMPEERLTLITCWPYGIDNHRIIVVAKPSPPNEP